MKRELNYLKYKFNYLEINHSFKIIDEFKANTYFYVVWGNDDKSIKICYEFTDINPIGIYVYDSDDKFMYRYEYFHKEFVLEHSVRDKKIYERIIDFAAKKFGNMIESNIVKLN